MSEYIVNVPDKDAELFIARFGIDGTTMFGYNLTGEIVRCRDCRHHEYMRVSYLNEPLSVCVSEMWIGAEGDNPLVNPDGFCAWGERKEI